MDTADNTATTENTLTTINSDQSNLDGEEVTIRAGSVIPSNFYSNSAHAHPGGIKVHSEAMLDWVVYKNLSIPAYVNTALTDFVKLYSNHNENRLEIIMSNGQIMCSSTFSKIGQTNLLAQEEGNVLLALAAQGLLLNKAQHPVEALLVGI